MGKREVQGDTKETGGTASPEKSREGAEVTLIGVNQGGVEIFPDGLSRALTSLPGSFCGSRKS